MTNKTITEPVSATTNFFPMEEKSHAFGTCHSVCTDAVGAELADMAVLDKLIFQGKQGLCAIPGQKIAAPLCGRKAPPIRDESAQGFTPETTPCTSTMENLGLRSEVAFFSFRRMSELGCWSDRNPIIHRYRSRPIGVFFPALATST
jgi:hypothetical protein